MSKNRSRELGVFVPENIAEIAMDFAPALIGTLEDIANPVSLAHDLIQSPEFQQLVENGQITVGMIKPDLHKHIDHKKAGISFDTDDEIVSELMGMLDNDDNIRPLLGITIQFDDDMLNKFYGIDPEEGKWNNTPKARMQAIVIDKNSGTTQWDEFKEMMLSGPSTFLIMASKNNSAVPLWRKKIGPNFDVTKAKPHELRHMALSNRCNIWHGSGNIKAVKHELSVINQRI